MAEMRAVFQCDYFAGISAFFVEISAFPVRLCSDENDSIFVYFRKHWISREESMRYRKNVGDFGEQFATEMLNLSGYRVIARNFRVREGEIDIIAIKDGVMHFIEVKTRNGDEFGYPSDSVTVTKQKKIKNAARQYLSSRRGNWEDVSFDVFEVMVNHIENCM